MRASRGLMDEELQEVEGEDSKALSWVGAMSAGDAG